MSKYKYWYEGGLEVYTDSVEEADEVFKNIFPPKGKGSFSLAGKTITYLVHDVSIDGEAPEV